MKKSPTKKKSETCKSKVLYKVFKFNSYGLSKEALQREKKKPLIGPFARVSYYDRLLQTLYTRNAKEFVAHKVSGPLEVCRQGYHAFTANERERWMENDPYHHSRVYKIRLYNCYKAGDKWVGDQFKILERVKVKDLSPRRWRD